MGGLPSRWLRREMEQGAREDPPKGSRPARDTGIAPNGHMAPPEPPRIGPRPLSSRPVSATAAVVIQIDDEAGDCLHQLTYNTPSPIPQADPEGRGRSIGQRIDEAIAKARVKALEDWRKLTEGSREAT